MNFQSSLIFTVFQADSSISVICTFPFNFLTFDHVSLYPVLQDHDWVMPHNPGRPGAEPCAKAAFADLGVKHFHGKVICASSSFSFHFLHSYSLSL